MAIAPVLKFESSPKVLAWKFPNSELNCWSQLIVSESQEAIFMKNGQVADVFGPGKYRLSSDNLPILQKFVNIPFGGTSPFSAEVWFINKAFSMDIKWGTSSPIQIQDPKYKVFVPLRAFGQFGIQIVDSKRFLIKLVGTMRFFNIDTLTSFFRGLYITRVKDSISSALINSGISILEINAHLNELSESLSVELRKVLADYGIALTSFFINDINVPENDPAVQQLKAALAKRAEMEILGYSYQQERTFNTLDSAAGNQGTAGMVMGSGIGLGMGFGIGDVISSQARGMSNNVSTPEPTKKCPDCGATVPEKMKFCPECGCNTTKPPVKVPKCASCGAAINKSVLFCPDCGAKIHLCKNCGTDMGTRTVCPSCGAGRCPNCGSMVQKGKKFCPECGTSVIRTCPGCGAAVEDGKKFCAECGQQLNG